MRLSDLELSCVDIIALFELLVVGHVFTKTLHHHSVPVLYVGLAVPLSKHMLCIFLDLCPNQRSPQPSSYIFAPRSGS